MRVLGIDHVQLAMPPGGEQRGREFYAGVLGLREVAKPAPLAARGGCWFEAPGIALHLGVEPEGFRPARKAHPALVVADLAAAERELAAAGAPVRWNDELPGRRIFTEDPFGNRIELVPAPSGPSGTSGTSD
jgi:catechol 2,3-dioxygenase-like lactoylglutathione lyase family enzyme